MTMDNLRPCPFCGNQPMFGKVKTGTKNQPPLFGITCIHCGTEMTGEFIPELTRRWNSRVAATATFDKRDGERAVDKVMGKIPNALRMLGDS